MRVQFNIPGKPFAWKRPRFNRKTGSTFNDGAQGSYYSTVGQIAMNHFAVPIEGPVGLTITAHFAVPQSWSKKKKAAMLGRPHTQRPDIDNLIKSLGDSMNRIAFADDQQVAAISSMKIWGETDKTTVIVESL